MSDRFVFTGPGGLAVVETIGEPGIVHVFARGDFDKTLLTAAGRCAEACVAGASGTLCDLSGVVSHLTPGDVVSIAGGAAAAGCRVAVVLPPMEESIAFQQELRSKLGDSRFRSFADLRDALAWLQVKAATD